MPASITKKYPEIPWIQIAKTRDYISHHYDGTDFSIIWNIIKKDMPSIHKEIKKIVKNLEKKELSK